MLTFKPRESHDFVALKMAGLAFLLLYYFVVVAVASGPRLPNTYHVTGTIYLPRGDIVEPYEAWVDPEKGMSRIDYYNGKRTCKDRFKRFSP